MGRVAQLVMGPAGAGKSTYCSTLITHCETAKRTVHLLNLDPAAEHFTYKPAIDIRDLVTLDDVVDELGLGPNGGMVYCLEFLLENLDWLEEEIQAFDDDYLIIDCPGQIELYTHFDIMRQLTQFLQRLDYRVCGVYLLDSQFLEDISKFFSGVMSAMSAMVQLEIPHVNVITKMDLVPEDRRKDIERYLDPDPSLLEELPGVARGALLYRPPDDDSDLQARKQMALSPNTDSVAASSSNNEPDAIPQRLAWSNNVMAHEAVQKSQNTNSTFTKGSGSFNNKYYHLTELIANLIHDYSLVSFVTLDITQEESVDLVLTTIDVATQYAEDLEPKDPGLAEGEIDPEFFEGQHNDNNPFEDM